MRRSGGCVCVCFETAPCRLCPACWPNRVAKALCSSHSSVAVRPVAVTTRFQLLIPFVLAVLCCRRAVCCVCRVGRDQGCVVLQVPPFDDLKIVGDLPELGAWNVAAAPTLLYARDRAFRRLRCLPPDTTATFKVVRVRGDGQLAGPEDFLWEDGPNRVITTGGAGDAMRVDLAFGDGEAVLQSTPEELQVRGSTSLPLPAAASASQRRSICSRAVCTGRLIRAHARNRSSGRSMPSVSAFAAGARNHAFSPRASGPQPLPSFLWALSCHRAGSNTSKCAFLYLICIFSFIRSVQ